MKDIVFNIIYIPNTVKLLWKFTESILNNSTINVRIISNFCTEDEISFLKQKVSNNQRLDLYIFKTDRVAPHHDVLNEIYGYDSNSNYFCFMDSDIFITADVFKNFLVQMDANSALYSGAPILHTDRLTYDGVNRLQGRHFFAKEGRLVGASYCTMYRRDDLNKVMDRTGLMFNRMDWGDLNEDIKKKLKNMDLQYKRYDTGKLLNIFLAYYGYKHTYYYSEDLFHVGGISDTSVSTMKNTFFIKFMGKNKRKLLDISTKRREIATYFTNLIKALIQDKELPDLVSVEGELEKKKLLKTTKELIHLYRKK